MKILYIGVHSHIKWGAEYWLNKAFLDYGIQTILFDYRLERKKNSFIELKELINIKSSSCDIIFLQRGDYLTPSLFEYIKIPIIFWSTEPIQLKRDVDLLLNSNIFSWIYIHSYSCLEKITTDFSHLLNYCSVLHNASPKEIISINNQKSIFSIFNRNLSLRRKKWLWPSKKLIKIIKGNYGDAYFNDLRSSLISINIHYSNKNLDDFESGIFEAMASGCVVISEKLNYKTLSDLKMHDAIIQINSPRELKNVLNQLVNNIDLINEFIEKSKIVINNNTWHNRAEKIIEKFYYIKNL